MLGSKRFFDVSGFMDPDHKTEESFDPDWAHVRWIGFVKMLIHHDQGGKGGDAGSSTFLRTILPLPQ